MDSISPAELPCIEENCILPYCKLIFFAAILFLFTGIQALAGDFTYEYQISNPAAETADLFGFSVSSNGTLIAVGARLDNHGASNAGTVYLYNLINGSPNGNPIHNPSPEENEGFGYDVALTSSHLAIGVENDTSSGITRVGGLYLHSLTSQTGFPVTVPVNLESEAKFGWAVATDGTWFLTSAHLDDVGGNIDQGTAYLYSNTGVLQPPIPHPPLAAEDRFGSALAISTTHIAIGAPGPQNNQDRPGVVHVYSRSGSSVTYLGPITSPTSSNGDQFGRQLRIDGNRLLVSAPGDDTQGLNSGRVFLYDLTSPTPTLIGQFGNPSPAPAGDAFGGAEGGSIAMSGDTVVIGALSDGGIAVGTVYVFHANGTLLQTIANPEPAPLAADGFGWSIALAGDYLIVGMPTADVGTVETAGKVYVYKRTNVAPTVSLQQSEAASEGGSPLFQFTVTDSDSATFAVGAGYPNCGSGTLVAGSLVLTASGGSFRCTFADGPQTTAVSVQVSDTDNAASNVASVSVTVVSVPPSAVLSAPTVVNTGASFSISVGSVSDPSPADTTAGFTYAFDCGSGFGVFSPSSSQVCTASAAASQTVQAKVRDKDSAETLLTRSVSINRPPVLSLNNAAVSVAEGSVASNGGGITDPDAGDVVSITPSFGAISRPTPSTWTWSAGVTDGPAQSQTVTITATDSHGLQSTASFPLTVLNVAPAGVFNAPSTVTAGQPFAIGITAATDASPQDTAAGFTYSFDCGSGPGAFGTSSTASCVAGASGSVTVSGMIRDKDGGITPFSRVVSIASAPVISAVNGPAGPLPAGSTAQITVLYTDANASDTHTCSFRWDDHPTSPTATTAAGAGSGPGQCQSSFTYLAAGVYTVSVTVTDSTGLSTTGVYEYVVVFDAQGGFVTGGGGIDSPAGAYVANPSLQGSAKFGFHSKYQRGASTPTGDANFRFHAGDFKFESTVHEWLVVAGAKAQFKGVGTVNNQFGPDGVSGYGFLLTATDGQQPGGGGVDKFRIKIWSKVDGTVVYDNRLGQAEDIDQADPQALAQGSIQIHR